MTTELILPTELVYERVRQRFQPFLKHCNAIAPAKWKKHFLEAVVEHLAGLPGPVLDEFEKRITPAANEGRPSVQLVTLPPRCRKGGKSLTVAAVNVARSLLARFLANPQKKSFLAVKLVTPE